MNLKLLEQAIRDINDIHKNVSEDHFFPPEDLNLPPINLKKRTISHFINSNKINEDFIEYINVYHAKMNLIIAYSSFDADYVNWDARMRVKQKESIQNKLIHYYMTNEDGNIPIQKCLNDLLGYRLIIDNFDPNNSDFKKLIEKLKNELSLMKCYTRDKDGYKATHIYFKNGENIFFPWELQIWATEDAESNEISHSEHKSKREYINWPKVYKEANIRKGD